MAPKTETTAIAAVTFTDECVWTLAAGWLVVVDAALVPVAVAAAAARLGEFDAVVSVVLAAEVELA